MLRRTYDWMMAHAAGPHAERSLAAVAFCEGIFFPIPPDVMLMPVVLGRPDRAWRSAAICLVSSVAGGSIGYLIGFFLAPVGRWLMALAGHASSFDKVQHWYAQWGALLLALPIPYKLLAITSGLAHFNFAIFVAASVLLRGSRFFLGAWLVKTYGEPIRGFVEKRLALVASALGILVIGAFVVLKVVL